MFTLFCAIHGEECGDLFQFPKGIVDDTTLATLKDPDVSNEHPGLGYAIAIPANGVVSIVSLTSQPLLDWTHHCVEAKNNAEIFGINPARDLGQARDAQRRADVNTIINAIYQYEIDNNGKLPFEIAPGETIELCRSQRDDCDGKVNLSALEGSYVVRVPQDPTANTEEPGAGYFITVSDNGRITVTATGEVNGDISVTR
jgi:hypothetical protein